MAGQVTVNLTAEDPRLLAVLSIGIGYDADIDRARRILVELARRHPEVHEVVGCPVIALGSSAVVLSLRAWCADVGTATEVEWDLYEQAKKRFDQAGIGSPQLGSLTHGVAGRRFTKLLARSAAIAPTPKRRPRSGQPSEAMNTSGRATRDWGLSVPREAPAPREMRRPGS